MQTLPSEVTVRPFRVVAGVTVAVTLLGCGFAAGGGDRRPPVAAASPTPSATALEDTNSPEEFQQDVEDARSVAERYWQAQFAERGLRFEPVRRIIAYEREGEVDCAGQPLGLNNAAYCSAGDFIAYDVNWAFEAFQQIGDAFVFYLLGHEYAHAIQVRLGVRAQFTIQQELQADCMAGAYIGDSAKPGGTLRLADGDIAELSQGLAAVADDPGQPWFAEGSHGTVDQRTSAFAGGYENSLQPCRLF